MANANVYFENVNGHAEIRYRTEGVAPVFAEKWFQKIQAEHDKQQARFTKAHHVMDLTPLVTDNDISDAVAAEIINEQLEAAAVAEQDAEHELMVIAKIRLMVLEADADAVAAQLERDIWQTKQEIIAMMTPVRRRYALRAQTKALNDTTNVPSGGSRYSSFSRQLENFNQTWDRSGETRRIA